LKLGQHKKKGDKQGGAEAADHPQHDQDEEMGLSVALETNVFPL
jgi:hypothetical protein